MADKQKAMIRFTKMSFFSVVGLLLGLIIAVGILTYIVPAGHYIEDEFGNVTAEFVFQDAQNRLPVYRWFTAPFEVWVSNDSLTLLFLSLLLLIMGGTFYIIENTGGMQAIINAIIRKFSKYRYTIIWVTIFFFMLLAALFGTFEDGIILLPIVMIMCRAMKWDNLTALGMMLLAAGVGISCTLINFFSIGLASKLAGTNVLTGIWLRIMLWLLMWVLTSLFVTFMFAKKAEKRNQEQGINCDREALLKDIGESTPEEQKKVKVFTAFYISIFSVIIFTYLVPVLVDYIMPIMCLAFLFGSIFCGCILSKCIKSTLKYFGKGMFAIAPAIIILMMSLSIKYIAERGEILQTIFYHFSEMTTRTGPYATIIIIYLTIFFFNFFIPSSSAKIVIMIPLLTLSPIAGISKELIVLAFVLNGGFADVFFPTSPVLLIGLSFAEVSYLTWFKKTVLFQILILIISCAVLLLGVSIGY